MLDAKLEAMNKVVEIAEKWETVRARTSLHGSSAEDAARYHRTCENLAAAVRRMRKVS